MNLEMKAFLTIITAASCPLSADAAVVMNPTFAINAVVPDNSAVGLSDTRTLSSTIDSISSVSVALTMRDGWAGDIYAYLVHGSGFSVLLNRPGKSLALPAGSDASRIEVTFTDDSLADIHNAIANEGVLSGAFQPDARNVDPANALDSSPRSAFLNTFQGLDANGDWTLHLFDRAGGDRHTNVSWGLELCGNVPLSTNLSIGRFTLDGGGGTSSNSVLAVRGTIGQPDAGQLSGSTLAIKGGFWGVITAIQTPGAPLLTITFNPQLSTVTVSWPSPSTGFNLQQNNDLNTANWTLVPPGSVADNGTTKSIIVNPPVGNRFYRLIKQ